MSENHPVFQFLNNNNRFLFYISIFVLSKVPLNFIYKHYNAFYVQTLEPIRDWPFCIYMEWNEWNGTHGLKNMNIKKRHTKKGFNDSMISRNREHDFTLRIWDKNKTTRRKPQFNSCYIPSFLFFQEYIVCFE